MIIGIGIDSCEISRMKKACERKGFTARFFSENERAYFEKRVLRAESAAAAFAVKEAVSKAFGTGIRGFALKDIELLHDELGKPYVKLGGGAKSRMSAIGGERIHTSITHSGGQATAFVLIEGRRNGE